MFNFLKDNRGVTAVEYGSIAAGISLAILFTVSVVGKNTEATFCKVASFVGTSPGSCSEVLYDGKGIAAGVDTSFTNNTGGNPQMNAETDLLLTHILKSLNANDPIVNIYGLYNGNGNPLSSYAAFDSYNTAYYDNPDRGYSGKDFSEGQGYDLLGGEFKTQKDMGENSYNTMLQVVGASGTVYNISENKLDYGTEAAVDYSGNVWSDVYEMQISNAKTGQVNQTMIHGNYNSDAKNLYSSSFTQ